MMKTICARLLPAAVTVTIALSALGLAAAPAKAQRAAAGPPDWPCVQRLVPELAWGTIWTGPSIDDLEEPWWSDPEIGRTVRVAGARATAADEALGIVRTYLEGVDGDREHKLTLLFAGIFEVISRERSQTIDAILRYSRGQVGRLERLGAIVDQLEEARRDADADPAEIERLEQELHWERRVFEDRQDSLRTLCLQPYLLEERLSRMVRAIHAEL
jgi:hypothetical protein